MNALVRMAGVVGLVLASARPSVPAEADRNDALLRQLQEVHGLSEAQMAKLRAVFAGSRMMGQGNPAVTRHPMTPAACVARQKEAGLSFDDPEAERICGARYMAPLYDAAREKPADAKACIDRFEFPNIPCTYPVVWVRASEAAAVCAAEGKRLCDAHEWEGGCAGSLDAPDYRFDLAKGKGPSAAVGAMRQAHNRAHAGNKAWSYGPAYETGTCAAASEKTAGCNGGDWAHCGSNTYPSGAFPKCHSASGVYDVNGNAAEHMNLPLDESQMSSRGSATLGVTEMKGSWFIFDRYRAHEDWCRWRAPFWHGSRVMDAASHENYHLGFRCCKTVR